MEQTSHSSWLGTALVLLGSIVTLLAAYQYECQIKHINVIQGHAIPASWLAMAIALLLGVIGIAMTVYLIGNTV